MQKISMLLFLVLFLLSCQPEEDEFTDLNLTVRTEIQDSKEKNDANRIRVRNIEALRKLSFSNIKTRKEVLVLGYYEPNDGGGGNFYWDAASLDPDNAGTVIINDKDGTGRWKRKLADTINVKWFGAKGNGNANDTESVYNAMAYSIGKILKFPKGTYNISSSLFLETGSEYIGEEATFNLTEDISLFKSNGPLKEIKVEGFNFQVSSNLNHAKSPIFNLWKNGGIVNCSFSNLSFSNLSTSNAVFKIGFVNKSRFNKITADGCGTIISLSSIDQKSEQIEINGIINKNGKSQTISLYSAELVIGNDNGSEAIVRNVSISNVLTEKCEGVAISIYRAADILIENCKIIDSWEKKQTDPLQNCGIRIVGSVNVQINKCFITRQGEEIETLTLNLDGEIIENKVVHGLNIEGSQIVSINDSSFSFLNGNGINLLNGGKYITINKCSVLTTYNGDGVAIHGTFLKPFKEIIISNCNMEGLSYDYYPKLVTSGLENSLKKPFNAGVYADFVENLKIHDLKVSKSGRGITLANGTKNVEIFNSIIEEMTQCGISFSSGIVNQIEVRNVTISEVGNYTHLEDWRRAGVLITANLISDVIFDKVKITSQSGTMKYGLSVGWGNELQRVKLNKFEVVGFSIARFNLSSQKIEITDE